MMMRKSKDALVSNLRLQPSMLKMQLEQLQLQQIVFLAVVIVETQLAKSLTL